MTQYFVDALGTVFLESSGMQPDDIWSLQNPSPVTPVLDLVDLHLCLGA
jgi:hypothetical protein